MTRKARGRVEDEASRVTMVTRRLQPEMLQKIGRNVTVIGSTIRKVATEETSAS